jgi:hypothetical protein
VRFKIVVRERGAERHTTLCVVETNPHDIADAAREKTLRVDADGTGRLVEVPKYERVWVVKDF